MPQPNRPSLFVAAGLLAAGAVAADAAHAANPSSLSESRGYQQCVDAADREVKVIKVDADYYLYDHGDTRRFYLNGYAFRNGASEAVKIACTTIRSGHRVLDLSIDQGRYAGRLVEEVNVAQN
ncbi:MAG: hypothetical protein RIC56_18200 [Pseudomonadales bacterium]